MKVFEKCGDDLDREILALIIERPYLTVRDIIEEKGW